MSLPPYLFSTHLPQKTFVRNVCRKENFLHFKCYAVVISLILHEPFFKSQNKEENANILGNIHKKQLILEL